MFAGWGSGMGVQSFSLSGLSSSSGCCFPFWGSPEAPKGGRSSRRPVTLHLFSFS